MPAGPEFSLSALRGRAIRFKTHVWALERPTSSRRVDKEHRTVYLALLRTRSDAQLRAEVLAVRHQLRELERRVGNPAWLPGDRCLLAALSRLLPQAGLPCCRARRPCSAGTAIWSAEVGGLSPAPSPAPCCLRS